MALRVARPHHVLEVARGVGPEAVEGDVPRAGEAARERGRARRSEKDLDVQQGGELRGEGRGGEEEEPVEDEEAWGRGDDDALGGGSGGLVLDFFAELTGQSEEFVVLTLLFAVVTPALILPFFQNNALAGTGPDRFAAVQPSFETGAQRGQIERRGAIPIAVAGPERQGGFRPVEVVGVHEGDVAQGGGGGGGGGGEDGE